jgi:hypothetical protein
VERSNGSAKSAAHDGSVKYNWETIPIRASVVGSVVAPLSPTSYKRITVAPDRGERLVLCVEGGPVRVILELRGPQS